MRRCFGSGYPVGIFSASRFRANVDSPTPFAIPAQHPPGEFFRDFAIRAVVVDAAGPGPRVYRNGAALGLAGAVFGLVLLASADARGTEHNEGIELRLSDELSPPPERPIEGQLAEEPIRRRGSTLRPRLSGLKLETTIGSYFDDNVRRTARRTESSMVVRARPKATVDGRIGRHGFRLGYEGDFGRFVDVSDENYNDHDFTATGDLSFSRRLRVFLDNGLTFGHDQRGDTTARLIGSATPDRWRRYHIGGNLVFGRASASAFQTKGEIGVSYQQSGTHNLNNNQSRRDYHQQSIGLHGRYNVGPKLSLVADTGLIFTDYDDPTTPLDARETDLLVGIAWKATAKTTGEVKFGTLRKDFYDPGQDDVSGGNWDAEIQWLPKSFSAVTIYASRFTEEAGQGGGSAVTDRAGLRWHHGFTSRLELNAGLEFSESEFGTGREDDEIDLNASLSYQVNRWTNLTGGYYYASRDSDNPLGEFDNNILFFELNTKLDRRPGQGAERD